MIERHTAVQNGRVVLQERKYHGVLRDEGGFRLLACCGKRVPLAREPVQGPERAAEEKRAAA